jgi:hypothetical protein
LLINFPAIGFISWFSGRRWRSLCSTVAEIENMTKSELLSFMDVVSLNAASWWERCVWVELSCRQFIKLVLSQVSLQENFLNVIWLILLVVTWGALSTNMEKQACQLLLELKDKVLKLKQVSTCWDVCYKLICK